MQSKRTMNMAHTSVAKIVATYLTLAQINMAHARVGNIGVAHMIWALISEGQTIAAQMNLAQFN